MKRTGILSLLLLACLTIPMPAIAGDFDWLKQLNLTAGNDLSDFRATLDTRFHVGDAQVRVVLSNVTSPADSYMVLRLSELSDRPVDDVLDVYRNNHDGGWGVVARHLGIKPGSRAFHALKRGHDLGQAGHGRGRSGKTRGNGKG